MKITTHILLALFIAVGMLAAAPVIPARADCAEGPNDTWTCSGADADGMDATTNSSTDTVTVDSGGTVDNPVNGGFAIQMTDGTLTNDGDVSENADAGTGIFAGGAADITNNGSVDANGISGTGIATLNGDVTNNGGINADGTSGTGVSSDTGAVVNNATISAGGDAGIGIYTLSGAVLNDGTVTADGTFGVGVFSDAGNVVNHNLISADGDVGTGIYAGGDVLNDGSVIADGIFGAGVVTDTGDVVNNNSISANGAVGTGIYTGGGDNTVTNNGNVFAGGADGMAIITGPGNDTVTLGAGSHTIGGLSTLDGLTHAICTCDGDDTVTINSGAVVTGIIDGGADNDILGFTFFTPSQLMGLDPASGSYMGYSWVNFEQLLGLLIPPPQGGGDEGGHGGGAYTGPRVYFRSDDGIGLGSEDDLGINVFARPGLIAFIPFSALGSIKAGGEGVRFQVANDDDWYVVVANLGPFEKNPGHNWYQVSIFDGTGTLVSDQQWFDF